MKFKTGDRVWVFESSRIRGQEPRAIACVVTKVGRKWVHYDEADKPGGWRSSRFDAETMYTEGSYSNRYRVWLSVADYEADHDANRAWEAFRRAVDRTYKYPATAKVVEEAARILGLAMPERDAAKGGAR